MFRKCCLPQCKSIRQDVKLHRFPVTRETQRKWLQCINSEKTRLSLTDDEVRKSYVCHKHFEKKFVNLHSNHLKVGAYPSLFTALEISTGSPSTISVDTDDAKIVTTEHTYTRKRHHHIEHPYALSIGHRPSKDARLDVSEMSPRPLTSSQPSTTASLKCTMQISSDIEMSLPASLSETVTTDNSQKRNGSVIVAMPSETSLTVNTSSTSTATPFQQLAPGIICKTPRRVTSRKLIKSVKSMTPRCRLLYTEYKKAKRQNNYSLRTKQALDFSKEKSLEEATKNMSPLSRRVLWMQIKLSTKNKKARRFSTEEKLKVQKALNKYLKKLKNKKLNK